MTAPSHARAAASTLPLQQIAQQRREVFEPLLEPQPESMPLLAVLALLEAQFHQQKCVYLMTTDYLQNWIGWVSQQPIPPDEAARFRTALPRVAKAMGLSMPSDSPGAYEEPGPIDASPLSLPGHPLLLRPDVSLEPPDTIPPELPPPVALRKALSLNTVPEEPPPDRDSMSPQNSICAVPGSFYELLRSVHGVICEDGVSVSFQPLLSNTAAIHHHLVGVAPPVPRPVEFRRRILYVPVSQYQIGPLSPMKRLLQQEASAGIPQVEVHPAKLTYSIVGDDSEVQQRSKGFVLVSRATLLSDAFQALRQAAAPHKARSCVRFWYKSSSLRQGSKIVHATEKGDGYDLVDLANPDGKLLFNKGELGESTLTVGQWMRRINLEGDGFSTDILVETRATAKMAWLRESIELGNRIKVGDFVDVQDTAGKWYEGVVRHVDDKSVTVHYAGWASRWDSTVSRRRGSEAIEGVSKLTNPPAPLWSQTTRWRENISIGDTVEIREASSAAVRPKWYSGTIRKISGEKDKVRDIVGGAELEFLEKGTDGKNVPLLLLGRTRQVLVDVPLEKLGDSTTQTNASSKELAARPPSLRWVNLYGEEICRPGTHLKLESAAGPATVEYDFDSRRPPVEIMKSFNNMHGAGFVRESLRGVPPAPGSVGFQNLGNSCFLNSIIQCLNHIEVLTQFFVKGNYVTDLNRSNPLGSSGRVATAYASLLSEIWSGHYSILAPRTLKQTVASFAPQFNNLYQHDSHEFCSFLMDGIHEDLNRIKKKPYVDELEGFGMKDNKAAVESWRKHLLRHDSIIVDHCQGMHRSHVTCPLCGKESIKFDVYSSISLPVQREKEASPIELSDCLERFTEGEQLDERNAWYCPGCRKHVCALKMIALWSVPDILILHLKRFTFASQDGKMVRSKIEDRVDFPIDGLDMSKYILGPIDDEAPPVYNLFGVSEHSGSAANSGHYTATVRNSKDGKWYRYNDSHVGRTSGEAALTGGAYLLFYQRRKGLSRWAGLEKAMNGPEDSQETDEDGFKQVKSKKGKKAKKR